MKTNTLVLAVIITFSSMTHGQTGNSNAPVVRTWAAEQTFDPWIKRGKLVYQTVYLNAGQVGSYVYKSDAGGWVLLSGSLAGLNVFLHDEIAKESAHRFLNEQMSRLLLAAMGPQRTSIITKEFVAFHGRSGDNSSVATLQRYTSDVKPVISSNDWTLEFSVASYQGGIERWRAAGHLAPLTILSFAQEIVEHDGAFEPLLETGAPAGR